MPEVLSPIEALFAELELLPQFANFFSGCPEDSRRGRCCICANKLVVTEVGGRCDQAPAF